jgi:hypothetical protein
LGARLSEVKCTLFAPGTPQGTPDLVSPLPTSQEVLSLTNGLSFEVAAPVPLELQCGVMNGSVQVDLGWIGATRVNGLVVQPTVGGPSGQMQVFWRAPVGVGGRGSAE